MYTLHTAEQASTKSAEKGKSERMNAMLDPTLAAEGSSRPGASISRSIFYGQSSFPIWVVLLSNWVVFLINGHLLLSNWKIIETSYLF